MEPMFPQLIRQQIIVRRTHTTIVTGKWFDLISSENT